MFCGNCGKEIADNAKFCPYCGQENRNAVRSGAQSGTPGVRGMAAGMGAGTAGRRGGVPVMGSASAGMRTVVSVPDKSIFSVLLMVCSCLHVLLFFVLSYGRLNGWNSALGAAASYLGLDVPQRLTGLAAIRVIKSCAEVGIPNGEEAYASAIIAFGLPILISVVIFLVNIVKRNSAVVSIILSVVMLPAYLLMKAVLDTYTDLGYDLGGGTVWVFLLTVVQLIIAVLNCAANKNA